eukprot:m.290972 g.290972  ORF g.290972 m.290972 type:complete len:102 (+) comp40721_c1_seq16:1271-1576(+)
MATSIIDIHQSIPCIPLPAQPIHYFPSANATPGEINIGRTIDHFASYLPNYCSASFLASLPSQFHSLDTANVQESLENMRCYSVPNQRDLDLLQSTAKIDE